MKLYYLTEILAAVADGALLVYLENRFFQKKDSRLFSYCAVLAAITAGLYLLSWFPSLFPLRAVYVMGAAIVLSKLFYEAPWQIAMLIGAIFAALRMGAKGFVGLFLDFFVSDVSTLMQVGIVRTALIAFTVLVKIPMVILLCCLFGRREARERQHGRLVILATQLACVAISCIVVGDAIQKKFSEYIILFMMLLVVVNVAVIFYAEMVHAIERERTRALLAEQQYQLETEYYRKLQESREETKALWHDIKKYILAMQALAESGKSEEARDIVRQANEAFNRVQKIAVFGNPVVDAVLSRYLQLAKENTIKVQMEVSIPEDLHYSPLDLTVIMGNTLDNAIDACLELPEEQRKIDIFLRKQNAMLFYKLENPCKEPAERKKNEGYHGYGLRNVQKTVRKCQGYFECKKKNGIFTVMVRVNCDE